MKGFCHLGKVGVLLAIALAGLPSSALGATTGAADIPSSALNATIDGKLDDALWKDALVVELDIETRPRENMPAPLRTTAYLIENGESLLLAFDARDPDPEAIHAYLSDRDRAYSDDFVGIVVDTYNDGRRAFEFFANPLGVQMDLTNDDVTGNEDDTWDAIWHSAGRITETGYTVEMEIPFSQLRFQRNAGEQTWAIDLLRFYPRGDRVRLSNNAFDRDRNCYLCQLSKIRGFASAEPGRNLEIVPTVTVSQTDSRNEPTDLLLSGDSNVEPGVSLRWGITPDMTANLAINPDFSQVEADVAQLDINNQFALFFPEKRPFFLEGADYFRSPIQAIFTRTVADPTIGAKFTGKSGSDTFGMFVVEDDITNLLLPGSLESDTTSLRDSNQTAVGRYTRTLKGASNIGALFTTRNGTDYRNTVAGLDGRWKADRHNLRFQYLRSDTRYPESVRDDFDQQSGAFDGEALGIYYDYESRSWFSYARFEDISPGFRADSGFVSRVDYDRIVLGLGHTWHGNEENWWNRFQLNGDWDITHDSQGRVLEREIEAHASVQGPLQSFVDLGVVRRQQLWDNVLFREKLVLLDFELRPRRGLELGMGIRSGDTIDFANTRLGKQFQIRPWVRWNMTQKLLADLRHTSLQLDTQDGAMIFDAQLSDFRLTWQFNLRSFLRLTVQRQDIERNQDLHVDEVDGRSLSVAAQLLYSYKINPQTVLFLGYSDRHLDDDSVTELIRTDRTVFLKVGYAWTP